MITTTHTLKCTNCDKEESYTAPIYPNDNALIDWYILKPNYTHCRWLTSDFIVEGDLCSLECVIEYVRKKIRDRDIPPRVYNFDTHQIEDR